VRLRLTARAEGDVAHILRHTHVTFGPRQVLTYASLIEKAFSAIAEDPERASSRPRQEIASGIRSFRIGLAGSRPSAASHVVYYVQVAESGRNSEVVILRVLHERMEPLHRVVATVRRERPAESDSPEEQDPIA